MPCLGLSLFHYIDPPLPHHQVRGPFLPQQSLSPSPLSHLGLSATPQPWRGSMRSGTQLSLPLGQRAAWVLCVCVLLHGDQEGWDLKRTVLISRLSSVWPRAGTCQTRCEGAPASEGQKPRDAWTLPKGRPAGGRERHLFTPHEHLPGPRASRSSLGHAAGRREVPVPCGQRGSTGSE